MIGKLPRGHQACLLEVDSIIKGWAYFGPGDQSDVWNLWWMGVEPKFQGNGYGKILLSHVEGICSQASGTQLLIETSSLLNRTRDLYSMQGYSILRIEHNSYGEGDDKVVYPKRFI